MRRSVVVAALALVACGMLSALVFYLVLQDVRNVANRADGASKRAEAASQLALSAEQAQCERTQGVRDSSNRQGAIIFRVLSQAAKNRDSPVSVRIRYKSLSMLPLYYPRPDCERAVSEPNYMPPRPRPFHSLPYWKVRQVLIQSR